METTVEKKNIPTFCMMI